MNKYITALFGLITFLGLALITPVIYIILSLYMCIETTLDVWKLLYDLYVNELFKNLFK